MLSRVDRRVLGTFVAVVALAAGCIYGGRTAVAAQSPDPFRVLILGDSYSAGNGSASDTFSSTTNCYRSSQAWGQDLARRLDGVTTRPVEVINRACGGATLVNIAEAQATGAPGDRTWVQMGASATTAEIIQGCRRNLPANVTADGGYIEVGQSKTIDSNGLTAYECVTKVPAQIDAVNSDVDLVVLTIGGNDLGFEQIASSCLVDAVPFSILSPTKCNAALYNAERMIDGQDGFKERRLQPRYEAALRQIDSKMNPSGRTLDRGQILAQTYPYLLRNFDYKIAGSSSNQGWRIKNLQDAGDALQKRVVDRVSTQAETAGGCTYRTAIISDGTKAQFENHSPVAPVTYTSLTGDWWLNGVSTMKASILHPNQRGSEAMGAAAFAAASAANVPTRINCNVPTSTTTTVPWSNGISMASVSTSGERANGSSDCADVSTSGRYVAFTSDAANLVPGDTNNTSDLFVRDTVANTTTRAQSATLDGGSGCASFSADDRYVAYLARGSGGYLQAAVYDRVTGSATEVSEANNFVRCATVSSGGRFVAFVTRATNLGVPDANGLVNDNVFLRDRQTGTVEVLSRKSNGAFADAGSSCPTISADGRFIAFESNARLVPEDANSNADIYIRDRTLGTIRRVSQNQDGSSVSGSSRGPVLSDDGSSLMFSSTATNFLPGGAAGQLGVFIETVSTRQIQRAFQSEAVYCGDLTPTASNAACVITETLPTYRSNVFILNRATGTVRPVSLTLDGQLSEPTASGGLNGDVGISGDGSAVAFATDALNLVSGPVNWRSVYLYKGAP